MTGIHSYRVRKRVRSVLQGEEMLVGFAMFEDYIAVAIAGTAADARRVQISSELNDVFHATRPHVTNWRVAWALDGSERFVVPFGDTAFSRRTEHRLSAAGRLLPANLRERQVREWVDHVESVREAGEDAGRALRSILLRSVVPVAIGSRVRRIGRALARSR